MVSHVTMPVAMQLVARWVLSQSQRCGRCDGSLVLLITEVVVNDNVGVAAW